MFLYFTHLFEILRFGGRGTRTVITFDSISLYNWFWSLFVGERWGILLICNAKYTPGICCSSQTKHKKLQLKKAKKPLTFDLLTFVDPDIIFLPKCYMVLLIHAITIHKTPRLWKKKHKWWNVAWFHFPYPWKGGVLKRICGNFEMAVKKNAQWCQGGITQFLVQDNLNYQKPS